jgi:hypothetical protein
MDSHPESLKNLNYSIIAQTQATMWTIGIFPIEAELSNFQTDDNTILLVEIGGGKGHATCKIRELCSDIKGRMILQDRKEVIDSLSGGLPRVEVMAYDFFTP